MFKKMFQKTAPVIELEKDFKAALEIADPLEKFLKLESMKSRALQLYQRGAGVTLGSMMCGVFSLGAGMATNNPFLVFGGVGLLVSTIGGMLTWVICSQDRKALDEFDATNEKYLKKIRISVLSKEGMLKMAQSPFFQEGMKRFPDLKEDFVLAAAQEKTLSTPPKSDVSLPLPKDNQFNI